MSAADDSVQQAADAISACDALWVGAGAGIGVDSGLPDFRGNEGFWNAYPPFKKLGLSFYDLADPRWFAERPEQAWGFYGHRYNLYRTTEPHDGFKAILSWGRAKPAGYFVFTSNVDGHFQSSGFDPERIVEVHGSIHHRQCAGPCCDDIWEAEASAIDVDPETMLAAQPLPQCPACGNLARPNILMFGDFNWLPRRSDRQVRRYQQWLSDVSRQRIVALEVGAGTAVPTVRYEAERQDAQLVRINVREPQTPHGGIAIGRGALQAIGEIDELLKNN